MIKNEIISEINIKENNSKERIINTLENAKRENPNFINIKSKENEKEIKDCEIYIK